MESHGSVRVRQDVQVAVAADELMSISLSDLCIVVVLCGHTHCTPLAQGCPRTNREVHSSYGQVFGKAHRTQDACRVFRCSCACRWVHLACASWECRTRPVVDYIAAAPAVYAAPAPAGGYNSLAPAVYAAPAFVASYVAPVPVVEGVAPTVSCVSPAPNASATQYFCLSPASSVVHISICRGTKSQNPRRGAVSFEHETPAIRGREVRHTSCSCCRCQAGVHVAQVKSGGACRL